MNDRAVIDGARVVRFPGQARRQDEPGVTLAYMRSSPHCVKLINREGRVTYVNESGRAALQISDLASVRGCQWHELWPAEGARKVRDALRRARRGETARFRAACPTAAGSPRDWEVTVSPVAGPGGRVESILAVAREVARG